MALDPAVVTARLAELRRLYVPETIEDTIERFECEHPPRQRSAAVQQHLVELRALWSWANR